MVIRFFFSMWDNGSTDISLGQNYNLGQFVADCKEHKFICLIATVEEALKLGFYLENERNTHDVWYIYYVIFLFLLHKKKNNNNRILVIIRFIQ